MAKSRKQTTRPLLHSFIKKLSRKKSIWKLFAIVIYLWKLINIFYKDQSKKPIVTFLYLDSVLLLTRSVILLELKQKHGHPSKKLTKKAKFSIFLSYKTLDFLTLYKKKAKKTIITLQKKIRIKSPKNPTLALVSIICFSSLFFH